MLKQRLPCHCFARAKLPPGFPSKAGLNLNNKNFPISISTWPGFQTDPIVCSKLAFFDLTKFKRTQKILERPIFIFIESIFCFYLIFLRHRAQKKSEEQDLTAPVGKVVNVAEDGKQDSG